MTGKGSNAAAARPLLSAVEAPRTRLKRAIVLII
jgi:hypothetical protein